LDFGATIRSQRWRSFLRETFLHLIFLRSSFIETMSSDLEKQADAKLILGKSKANRWIDDCDGSLALITTVEDIRSTMTVSEFVSTFKSVRELPVALACLADKVSKIMGDLDSEYASSIFAAPVDTVEGTGPPSMKLTALFNNLMQMAEEMISTDMENTL